MENLGYHDHDHHDNHDHDHDHHDNHDHDHHHLIISPIHNSKMIIQNHHDHHDHHHDHHDHDHQREQRRSDDGLRLFCRSLSGQIISCRR